MLDFETPHGACRLRDATSADAGFQRDLFHARHAAMLRAGGLPEAMIDNLASMQYRARTISYREKYPSARWSIIEAADGPIGELIACEQADALHIVDIALAPEWRGRGVGGALMRAIVASRRGVGDVRALVALDNPRSRRMFDRVGFIETWRDDVFAELRWRAP
ncbi:MAG: N-acetyltransferase [Pseudomonadota bacterium]|nr:N-acetyltransferase [Pseudomonadota bacterium]